MKVLDKIIEQPCILLFNGSWANVTKARSTIMGYYHDIKKRNINKFDHINHVNNENKYFDTISYITQYNITVDKIKELQHRIGDSRLVIFNIVDDDQYDQLVFENVDIVFTDNINLFKDSHDDYKYASSLDFSVCKYRFIDHEYVNKINILKTLLKV